MSCISCCIVSEYLAKITKYLAFIVFFSNRRSLKFIHCFPPFIIFLIANNRFSKEEFSKLSAIDCVFGLLKC